MDDASATRPLRVIMAVSAAVEVGGLEASFARVAQQLREIGVIPEALVMGPAAATSPTAAFLRAAMPVHTAASVGAARKIIRTADAVHVHAATMTTWPVQALVAAGLARVPAVVTIHLPSHPNRERLRGRLRVAARIAARGVLLRLGAGIVAAPSAAAAELAERRLRAFRVAVRPLWNGVRDAGVSVLPNGGPLRAVFIGRLSPHKRPLDFVAAVNACRDGGADVTATLVGDGPLRPDVEDAVAGSPHQAAFRIVGQLDDPSDELRAAHVLVHTATTEGGFPLVAMEAAALGRCVVLRQGVEGLAEAWTGAVVTVQHDADAASFADALHTLCEDRAALARFGTAARVRFEQAFSAQRAAQRLRAIYDEVAST